MGFFSLSGTIVHTFHSYNMLFSNILVLVLYISEFDVSSKSFYHGLLVSEFLFLHNLDRLHFILEHLVIFVKKL